MGSPIGSAGFAAAAAFGMLTSFSGCRFEVGGLPADDAGVVDAARDSGIGRDGGMDVGPILGTQYIPTGVSPSLGARLLPTRALLHWSAPSAVPSGRTLSGYDVCWATGTVNALGDETQCPNAVNTANTYSLIASLSRDTQYFWKVRARYQDGATSYYSFPQPFLTNHSLVGWLKLDEGMGTAAADASGNGNNGALQNSPVWTPGIIGQSLQFDGTTTRYVSVNDAPSLNFGTGDFSLGAWVRSNATGANQAIIDKRVTGNGYILYKNTAGQLGFWDEVDTGTNGGVLTDGVWHYVVATRSATTVNLYVDGAMVATGNSAVNIANTSPLNIGCDTAAHAYGQEFNGNIDEVMLADMAMSPEIILNNFCGALAAAGVSPLPPNCLP